MRRALLCSLLVACVPEDKSPSTTSATDGASSGTTAEVTTGGSTSTATATATSSDSAGSTSSSPVVCDGVDEHVCFESPGCTALYGAKHVLQNGMICADVTNQQYLGCGLTAPPCPPVVVTVCPLGQPDIAFDVASGCVPPGYEVCMDGPVAECP